jgi:DNA-binding beta-propeller fold protein YncE
MKRFLWLWLVLSLYLICSGCGQTYRPIIIPNPPVFPNPKAAHTVLSINDNGTVVPGTAMVVDVSGDTDVSVVNVGLAPVHAVQQTANQVLVVNHSATGALADSITKLTFNSILISSSSTISLPANSAPNFVATTESSQAYVSLPSYVPDPVNNPGVVVPSVGVINTNSNSLINTIPVGTNPVAIAETPNSQKLYVASEGDNTVRGFNTVDRSARTILTFSAPVWLAARSDSQRLYVLNGPGGTNPGVVSTVDTTSTAGPDTVIDASITALGASYMLYDGNKNRLYIPGTGLTMLDVSQSIPAVIGGGPIPICVPPSQSACIPMVPPSSRSAGDPCASTTGVPGLTLTAVTALPDGSRAYVGGYYGDSAGNICPQVTVIDAVSNAVKSSIAIPGFPAFDTFCSASPASRFRVMMASAGDSSRAYLSSCDGGNVNIIDTSTDTYIGNLPAPVGSRLQNPPQNPVFLIAGP